MHFDSLTLLFQVITMTILCNPLAWYDDCWTFVWL